MSELGLALLYVLLALACAGGAYALGEYERKAAERRRLERWNARHTHDEQRDARAGGYRPGRMTTRRVTHDARRST